MDRRKIILNNVSLSLVFKVLNMGIVYLTIPFLLQYLGSDNYGIWVTIFSVINILFFIDGGIGNGLKTKLTEALATENKQLAKEYISTAYGFIFFISLSFLVIGYVVIESTSLIELLNTGDLISESELKSVFTVALVFIFFNFILSLFKTLFYSIQKAATVEISLFIYQFVILLCVYYALYELESSLITIAVFYGLTNVLISLFYTLVFFRKRKVISPSFHAFKKERIKSLMGLSIEFFIIQLCMIIIFTSDNILIIRLLGPEEVSKYDVIFKIFQILITFSIIFLNPFWALFTDAYQKKDFFWIKKMLKKLNYLFLGFLFVVLFVSFLANDIITLWVGEEFKSSNLLIYLLAVFVVVRVFGTIYMLFLNGVGKVKIQMWLFIFGAIINIPISIYFVTSFNLGSSGIILGTIVSMFSLTVILPIQAYKILNRKNAS